MLLLLFLAFYLTAFVSAQSSGLFLPIFANSTFSRNATTTAISTSPSVSSGFSTVTNITHSSTSSPTASPIPLSCPASHNTLYTAPSGQQFVVECSVDHARGDLTSTSASSLEACIAVCDDTEGCLDVSLSGFACYLKYLLGAAVASPGLLGARVLGARTPISCPASSGSNYTTSTTGKVFQVECGVDYAGGNLLGSLGMDGVGELWLQKCVESCGNVTGCVDVSLSGSACYLKSSIGEAQSNSGIAGARLLSPVSTTTTSSAAVSTPTPQPGICDTNSPTCPACNNTILYSLDSEPEKAFRIECGVDRPGGDMASQVNEHTGLRGSRAFRNCLEDCAEVEGCVDVSLLNGVCYLKDVLEVAVSQPLVWGARLLE